MKFARNVANSEENPTTERP